MLVAGASPFPVPPHRTGGGAARTRARASARTRPTGPHPTSSPQVEDVRAAAARAIANLTQNIDNEPALRQARCQEVPGSRVLE